jgi:hypothetical protein
MGRRNGMGGLSEGNIDRDGGDFIVVHLVELMAIQVHNEPEMEEMVATLGREPGGGPSAELKNGPT